MKITISPEGTPVIQRELGQKETIPDGREMRQKMKLAEHERCDGLKIKGRVKNVEIRRVKDIIGMGTPKIITPKTFSGFVILVMQRLIRKWGIMGSGFDTGAPRMTPYTTEIRCPCHGVEVEVRADNAHSRKYYCRKTGQQLFNYFLHVKKRRQLGLGI